MIRILIRATAAVVLTAAVGLVVPTLGAAPAQAAVCSGSTGVTVVVDPHGLGGGPRTHCVEGGGGKTAKVLFPAAGEPLDFAHNQPGMVCRVSGVPADEKCVNAPPANAYWGLFWSDGESGTWNYSTVGVGGLTVPAGGSVAFSWQGGSRTPPGVKPPVASAPKPAPTTSSPTPTPKPAPKSSAPKPSSPKPSSPATSPADSGSSSSPSDTPADESDAPGPDELREKMTSAAKKLKKAEKRERRSGSAPPEPTEAEPTESSTSPTSTARSISAADDDGGGLPTWLVLGLIAALSLAAVSTAYLRRRRGTAAP